jgi:hypothetical protein
VGAIAALLYFIRWKEDDTLKPERRSGGIPQGVYRYIYLK